MTYSNRQAAEKLGISDSALSKYVLTGKIPAPKSAQTGGIKVYFWTEADIERVRKLLPKIANGRKTRYQKQKGKTQKPQPRAAVPHKTKKSRPAQ